jgi:hypothetical protein
MKHPIRWDMHEGMPPDCTTHQTLRFERGSEPTASDVVKLLVGKEQLNKMLKYIGVSDGRHRYVYSYDTYTLGIVEFEATEQMHVVAYGNAFDGLRLVGPFGTYDEAIEYANVDNPCDDWNIVPVSQETC